MRRFGHPGVLALLVAVLAVALQLTGGLARWGWQAGAGWPFLLLAQLVHLNTAHLLLNLAGLALLAWCGGRLHSGPHFAGLLLWTWMVVAFGLASGWPAPLQWYAGLSGVLYGLFCGLALQLLLAPGPGRGLGALLLAGAVLKTAFDLRAGTGSPGALGIPLAPAAHLWGLAGGALYVLGVALARRVAA